MKNFAERKKIVEEREKLAEEEQEWSEMYDSLSELDSEEEYADLTYEEVKEMVMLEMEELTEEIEDAKNREMRGYKQRNGRTSERLLKELKGLEVIKVNEGNCVSQMKVKSS